VVLYNSFLTGTAQDNKRYQLLWGQLLDFRCISNFVGSLARWIDATLNVAFVMSPPADQFIIHTKTKGVIVLLSIWQYPI